MSTRLSPPWLHWPETQTLAAVFAENNVRFVGGAVRDALLQKPVQDVDAATLLLPHNVMALLESNHIRAIPTGITHGTVTAVIDGKSFEITTLRKDITTDGRHAEVAYTDDWQQDAARRDFTMNALYLSPEGELFDYFGGAADALAGQVRFIGDPSQRMAEDYLRLLRFFRFFAWYGKGDADNEALAACAAAAPHIKTLSGERIWQEMQKLLIAPRAQAALALMQRYGIATLLFGSAIEPEKMALMQKGEAKLSLPPQPLVRLAAITPPRDFITRWRLSGQEMARWDILQHRISSEATVAEQKKSLRRLGAEAYCEMLLVNMAQSDTPDAYLPMLNLPQHWQIPLFPVKGADMIALGFKPGKPLGELLRQLEEEWEKSDYSLTKEELLEIAKRQL